MNQTNTTSQSPTWSLSSLITILLLGPVGVFFITGCVEDSGFRSSAKADIHGHSENDSHDSHDSHDDHDSQDDHVAHDAHASYVDHRRDEHDDSQAAQQEDDHGHAQQAAPQDSSLMGKAKNFMKKAQSAGSNSVQSATGWVQDQMGNAQNRTNDAMDWANETFQSLKAQGLTSAESTSDWLISDWKNMESWEYEVVSMGDATGSETLKSKLNELGKQGWECFHVSVDGKTMMFKRARESYLRRLPFKDLLRLAPLLNQGKNAP